MRALELFSGIGGFAAAVGSGAEVVAALDINSRALDAYRHNFDHPTVTSAVEHVSTQRLAAWRADVWWMSPPCQPFTRRGLRRDLDDPRSRGLRAVIHQIDQIRPAYVALENVSGFEGSRAHAALRRVLDRAHYTVREQIRCSTELGVANRRSRFYLVAGRGSLSDAVPLAERPRWPAGVPLADLLDRVADPALSIKADVATAYRYALHVVDAADPRAVTSCFTGAYGRSPVRSGSYLRDASGLRRFSPAEILRLLGFPSPFRLPKNLSPRQAWPLVGNALSIPVVASVLSAIPGLMEEG